MNCRVCGSVMFQQPVYHEKEREAWYKISWHCLICGKGDVSIEHRNSGLPPERKVKLIRHTRKERREYPKPKKHFRVFPCGACGAPMSGMYYDRQGYCDDPACKRKRQSVWNHRVRGQNI